MAARRNFPPHKLTAMMTATPRAPVRSWPAGKPGLCGRPIQPGRATFETWIMMKMTIMPAMMGECRKRENNPITLKPATGTVSTHQTAGIGALNDRQPQQHRRLQNRDKAAHQKGHAVEIGDLLRRKIEGSSQNAGKYKHSRHAKNVLQP